MSSVRTTVLATIRRYGMISPRDAVLAAVSGGPDSVCMLHVLADLREELEFELKVAHLEHGFRGEESRADAAFVRDLAERLAIPFFCDEVSVPRFLLAQPMSAQDAARMLRYQFLVKVSKLEFCQRIATGHNADDQAETVLMRLLRGAGPDGLAGIPPKREGTIIRPLLAVWRSDVMAYLEERGLPWRTDATNLDSKYLRNEIRNEVMPLLERHNPNLRRALANVGTAMTDIAAHLGRLTDEALPRIVKRASLGQFVLDSTALGHYDEALRRCVFRRLFEALRPDLGPLPFRHVEGVLSMAREGRAGASVELPGGVTARLEHGALVIACGRQEAEFGERALCVPGSTAPEGSDLVIEASLVPREQLSDAVRSADESEAFFDWDALRPPLVLRPRREGDRFRPFGLEGTKTVKELLIDEKVAFSFRPLVPILCDADGILWVVGLRRADRAPVTDRTGTVLALKARRQEATPGTREGSPH
ncbi:MAG: tRNA lysidine(34) synthetase TilS [Candidatus Eisenbacteria bacterium]|nr:tRNA lysidine(34) synthetase TilS [Candidatus Eisenbacteria bacterium]